MKLTKLDKKYLQDTINENDQIIIISEKGVLSLGRPADTVEFAAHILLMLTTMEMAWSGSSMHVVDYYIKEFDNMKELELNFKMSE